MKKKILITGISGMLGSAILRTFQFDNKYKIFGVSRNKSFKLEGVEMFYGDLSDNEFVKSIKLKFNFDIIIHCSAEINVNLCETNKIHAYNSNVVSTENLVSLNPNLIIFISTDAVFDGKVGNYSEDSLLEPLNYYAETKILAENVIKKSKSNYLILRTNIYGFNQPMKNTLFEWAYKELKENREINGFTNMYFNPLYVGQVAELLLNWVKLEIQKGIYHIGSFEFVSKYEFLNQIINVFEFDKKLLKSISYNYIDFGVPRSLNTTLDTAKTKKIFSNFNFSLSDGILEMKKDFERLNFKVYNKN